MSQIIPSSSSTKILMLQLNSRPSPFHVGKILLYAIYMPNEDDHKIDLTSPCTKHKNIMFKQKSNYLKKAMRSLSLRKTD